MFSSCLRSLFSHSLSHYNILPKYTFSFKRFVHNYEYLNIYLKNDYVKKLFSKLQSDEVLLREYSIKNSLLEQYVKNRKEIIENLSSLLDLKKDSAAGDGEFKIMLDEELEEIEAKLLQIECQLLDAVVPKLPISNEVVLEISAGVGGQEAMLFAKRLYDMYRGYVSYKNWLITTEDLDLSDLGGLRHASLFIEGESALTCLKQESGVHRVQRVPATEKSGRMHTSTVTVAVLPQPKEIDLNLNQKDLVIETKRSSGAGGQHVNKTESAVRITHLPSRISVECQTDRSQIKNRQIAFQKLCAKLFMIQQKEQTISSQLSRKLQVGTSSRSDKVRTYNFPQDRVTDHRISRTMHNIPVFLEGGEMLEGLISDLVLESEKIRFEQFLISLKNVTNL